MERKTKHILYTLKNFHLKKISVIFIEKVYLNYEYKGKI